MTPELDETTLRALANAAWPGAGCEEAADLSDRVHRGEPGAAEEAHEHLEHCVVCLTTPALSEAWLVPPHDEDREALDHMGAHLDDVLGDLLATEVEDTETVLPFRRRVPWASLAMAAAVLLVVGVARRVQPPPLNPPPTVGVTRGATLVPRGPLDAVVELPRALSWEGLGGEVRYRVNLGLPDGRVLWTAEVAEPSAPLPEAVRGTLQAGTRYVWSAEAVRQGEVVARTLPASFMLVASP